MTSLEYLTQLKRLHDLIEEEQADLEDEREELESGSDLPTTGKEAFLKRLEILEKVWYNGRKFGNTHQKGGAEHGRTRL